MSKRIASEINEDPTKKSRKCYLKLLKEVKDSNITAIAQPPEILL